MPPSPAARSARLLLGTLAALTLPPAAVFVAQAATASRSGWDLRLSRRVADAPAGLDPVWHALALAGTGVSMGAAAGVAGLVAWRRGSRRWLPLIAVVFVGAEGIAWGLKWAIDRPRPDGGEAALGASFPSAHTLVTTALATTALVALAFQSRGAGRRRAPLIALAATAPLAMGVSRMALGVHYATDIAAGLALGAGWALACAAVAAPRLGLERPPPRASVRRVVPRGRARPRAGS